MESGVDREAAPAEHADGIEYAPYEEMLEADRRRKRRRVVIGALAALLLVGGGGAFTALRLEHESQQRLEQSWSRTVTCLTGDAIADEEEAARRVRGVQLAVLGLPELKRRAGGHAPWPLRCAAHAHATAEALEKAGNPAPLAASVTALARALTAERQLESDLIAAVGPAWRDARALGLTPARAADVPAVPSPVTPLTQDALERLPRFLPSMVPLSRVELEPVPSGALRFLIDDGSQPLLPAICTFEPHARVLDCKRVPDSVRKLAPGLALWGTTEPGAAPFLFAGERGQAGIFRSTDGARVSEGLTYGASARADGSLVRTVWREQAAEVWYSVLPREGKPWETKVLSYDEVGNPYYNSGLFWDYLVYKARNRDSGALELYVRKVGSDGKLGERTTVGELPEPSLIERDDPPHIMACRTEEAVALRVKGKYRQFVTFFSDGRWTPPAIASGIGGDLTCRRSEATITHVMRNASSAGTGRYWPTVLQARCTPASCSSATVAFKDMLAELPELVPIDKAVITAAELRGEVLIVWGAGERGGLRLRSGPVERVAKAPDVVLFDDAIENGAMARASTLLEARLVSSGEHATLFLSTGKGIYAFHVSNTGKLEPVRASFG